MKENLFNSEDFKSTDHLDPHVLSQIRDEYLKLTKEAGISPMDYQDQVEKMLGVTSSEFDELNDETMKMLITKVVKIKLIHPDAIMPSYAYPTDSGFDLFSTEKIVIEGFGRSLVPTGIQIEFPENFEIQVRPKSGLAINQGITVLNTPGTVDFGYTGEIKVILFNTNSTPITINKGMKIAQAVLCPVVHGKYVSLQKVENLNEKDRGSNGFGSTGL